MKVLLTFILIGGAMALLYYFFYTDHKPIDLQIQEPLTVKCEKAMQTMKFDSPESSNQYYIDCLAGKFEN